jgi:carbonic anhydrase/acetyltransferase-like protein (isoleucine patch superfamily)
MPIYALGDVAPRLPDDGDFWIAPDVMVIGDLVMKSGASLWFGIVVRADDTITIGENSNIQDRCVLHVDAGEPLTTALTASADSYVANWKRMVCDLRPAS